MKTHNIISNIVQLTIEEEEQYKEMIASLSFNKTIKWIKFILTDANVNANKQRIPKNEFTNLIRTGLYMPIKMAQGYIREDHEFSVPIGTITNLIEREDRVEGIAALWGKEYPEEVKLLQEMSASDKKPQISWEIIYTDSKKEDEIEVFENVQLAAATIVGMPAYQGRTPILVVASKNKEGGDSSMEINEKEFNDLKASVATLTSERDTLKTSLETLQREFDGLKVERDTLASFKADADAKAEKEAKIAAIKKLFADAKVALPEDYFADEVKASKMLSMSTDQLEYVIQELLHFAPTEKNETSSQHLGADGLPNLKDEKKVTMTPKEIAEAMKKAAAAAAKK
jgi:hypothetical protein